MMKINSNGDTPTSIQQHILESLQADARTARRDGLFPKTLIEETDFSAMSPRMEEVVERCKTVLTHETLDADYKKRVTLLGKSGFLKDEYLQNLIAFEASKDLTCDFYRAFWKLEPQEPVVSPDEVAKILFLKNEAMYYTNVLWSFQNVRSGSGLVPLAICERFALDFNAQPLTPKKRYASNLF